MPVCARVRVGVPVPIIDAGSVRPNHKKRHRAPPTLRRKIKRQSMRAKHSAPTDRPRSARRRCRGWAEGRVFRARDGAPGDGPTCAFRRSLRYAIRSSFICPFI